MFDLEVALLWLEFDRVELFEVLVHRDVVIVIPVLKSQLLGVLIKVNPTHSVGPPLPIHSHHHSLIKLHLNFVATDYLFPLLNYLHTGGVRQKL